MSDDPDFISKTQRKKQMHDLQGLGADLVKWHGYGHEWISEWIVGPEQ